MVEKLKITIVRAAKVLRIKLPTAKVILMNYRKYGRVFHKKSEAESV